MKHYSAGSIPALGLFASNWTLVECEDAYSSICKKAFAGNNLSRFRSLHRRLRRSSKSRYGSANLEKALKEEFSESQPLFGGSSAGKFGTNTKVAIPAVSSSGRATLFPNYNRRSLPYRKFLMSSCGDPGYSSLMLMGFYLASYKLLRPENEQNEIKLWEA